MINAKITKQEFEKLYSKDISKRNYDAIIEKINQRFSKIVGVIKCNDKWFDYDNCSYDSDESGGYFDPERYKENIGVGGYVKIESPYEEGFPTRWLWEDFEDEFNTEVEKFKKRQTKKQLDDKAKREQRKQKLLSLQESIKSKLTPEELKAINFKK